MEIRLIWVNKAICGHTSTLKTLSEGTGLWAVITQKNRNMKVKSYYGPCLGWEGVAYSLELFLKFDPRVTTITSPGNWSEI